MQQNFTIFGKNGHGHWALMGITDENKMGMGIDGQRCACPPPHYCKIIEKLVVMVNYPNLPTRGEGV